VCVRGKSSSKTRAEILQARKQGQKEVMSRGQTSQKLSLISVVLLCLDGLPWRGPDGYCWCWTGFAEGREKKRLIRE